MVEQGIIGHEQSCKCDFELLEPLQVIEFDPESRYLVVVQAKEKLPDEAIVRIRTVLHRRLKELLGQIKFDLVVMDGGLELNFYQFKEKSQ